VEEDKVWNAVASGAAIGAVVVSKPVLERTWRLVFRSDPPGNPAHHDVAWRDALLWALITGALVGVIRLVAQRAAAGAWYRLTGDYPEALAATRP
jgi:hypothetical protein